MDLASPPSMMISCYMNARGPHEAALIG